MKLLWEVLGSDLFAAMVVFVTIMVCFLIYLAFVWVKGLFKPKVVKEAPMIETRALCPHCKTDLLKKLDAKTEGLIYSGYGLRTITCDCLSVSKWDILGLPVCLEWRQATADELKAHYEREERRHKQKRLDELMKIIEKAKASKRKKY